MFKSNKLTIWDWCLVIIMAILVVTAGCILIYPDGQDLKLFSATFGFIAIVVTILKTTAELKQKIQIQKNDFSEKTKNLLLEHENRMISQTAGHLDSLRLSALQFSIDLKLKQLSDLYGKIKILNEENRALRAYLVEIEGEGWHFLYNAKDILSKKGLSFQIMKSIVENNEQIESILVQQSGLLLEDDNEGLVGEYLRHVTFVNIAFNGGFNIDNGTDCVFPSEWPDFIERKCKLLNGELKNLMEEAENEIKRLGSRS